MSSCIYGGRIDNEFDQRLLIAFVEKYLDSECFRSDFKLVEDDSDELYLLKGQTRKEDYLRWIESIQLEQKPSWLGLPNNAECILLKNMGI